MTVYQAFVEKALSFVGCHYVWAGRGDKVFTLAGLAPHKFTTLDNPPAPLNVFDCSGLVSVCLWLVTQGRVDLRATHGAKTMWDTFPEATNECDGRLLLYPGHVQIDLGRNRVVEACGGDESTLSIQAALDRNAGVMAHLQNRNPAHLLGARMIPLDKSELRSV